MGTTKTARDATRRAAATRRALATQLRDLRQDAGLTQRTVARIAGVSQAYLARLEAATINPTLEGYQAVAAALGADLSVRVYPNTGPRIRDRHQARIEEALLRSVHPRWRTSAEVPVTKPVRGVVDLVLFDPGAHLLIATEIDSEVRRLEQRLRWHAEKAEALRSSDVWRAVAVDRPPDVSRLLVLRSTSATRELARAFEATLRTAYPARTADAVVSLTGMAPWPGPAVIWARIDADGAQILPGPPRGVALGR